MIYGAVGTSLKCFFRFQNKRLPLYLKDLQFKKLSDLMLTLEHLQALFSNLFMVISTRMATLQHIPHRMTPELHAGSQQILIESRLPSLVSCLPNNGFALFTHSLLLGCLTNSNSYIQITRQTFVQLS